MNNNLAFVLVFVVYEFFSFLECIYLKNYQNMSHYHHLHLKLSNEFLLICTHQDLLYVSDPLSQVNYFLKKKPIKFGLVLIRSLHLIINQRMSWHWKSFTALIFFPQLLLILVLDSMLSLPYLLTHFSNKAAFDTPNIILINSFCCYFDLFSVDSLTNFYQ